MCCQSSTISVKNQVLKVTSQPHTLHNKTEWWAKEHDLNGDGEKHIKTYAHAEFFLGRGCTTRYIPNQHDSYTITWQ